MDHTISNLLDFCTPRVKRMSVNFPSLWPSQQAPLLSAPPYRLRCSDAITRRRSISLMSYLSLTRSRIGLNPFCRWLSCSRPLTSPSSTSSSTLWRRRRPMLVKLSSRRVRLALCSMLLRMANLTASEVLILEMSLH